MEGKSEEHLLSFRCTAGLALKFVKSVRPYKNSHLGLGTDGSLQLCGKWDGLLTRMFEGGVHACGGTEIQAYRFCISR